MTKKKAKPAKAKPVKVKPVANCPCCGTELLEAVVRSAYGSATSQMSRGVDLSDIEVPTPCCGQMWTYQQIKSLWGAFTSQRRKSFGAGTGRPTVERLCPRGCGRMFSARALRAHLPNCPGPESFQ